MHLRKTVANIFALFSRNPNRSLSVPIFDKSPLLTHSLSASQTDEQTDGRTSDLNSGAFTT